MLPPVSIAALIQNSHAIPAAPAIMPNMIGLTSRVALSSANRTPSASPERPSGERAYMMVSEIGWLTLRPQPKKNAITESAVTVDTNGTSAKVSPPSTSA